MGCNTITVQQGLNLVDDGVYGNLTRGAVSTLQRGVGANTIDGLYFGPDTEGHVSVIQMGIGAQADGCWGIQTNAHCRTVQAGISATGGVDGVYGPGTRGSVSHAQDVLRDNGADPGPSDGLYGNGTHAAVARYQQQHGGLAVDGILGPATGAALGLVAPPPPPGPGPGPSPAPSGTWSGEGIDVFEGNGDISWGAVHGAGRNFACVKVNEGDHLDSRFTSGRVQALDQAGVRFAGYNFVRVQTFRSGADEANIFLNRMRAVGGGLRRGDLAPACDFEVSNGFSVSTIWAYLQSWAFAIHQAGVPVVMYCSPAIWAALTPGPVGSGDNLGCALWIAHYGVSRPTIPIAWNHADAWQFSSSGSVPGVSPPTDLDHGYSWPII